MELSASISGRARAEKEALQSEQVRTPGALFALSAEWQQLWQRIPDATPFQSDAWLLPWWRAYGDGRLFAWAFRRSGRLVALAPLYLHEQGRHRRVLLLGTGNTDYLDLLSEPAHARAAAAQLLRLLARSEERWESVELQQLPPDSPLTEAPLPPGLGGEILRGEPCPVLSLAEDAPRLQAMRRRAAQERRRLVARAPVASERAEGARLDEIFEALVRLHGARWAARGAPGVLAAVRDRAFHREACEAMLQAGMLRLLALRCGGRIIAAYYGFQAKGRSFYYLSGFDGDFAAYSPGLQIIADAVDGAAAEEARSFDFLRGTESYKYRWGAVDRPTLRRRIWRK